MKKRRGSWGVVGVIVSVSPGDSKFCEATFSAKDMNWRSKGAGKVSEHATYLR